MLYQSHRKIEWGAVLGGHFLPRVDIIQGDVAPTRLYKLILYFRIGHFDGVAFPPLEERCQCVSLGREGKSSEAIGASLFLPQYLEASKFRNSGL
jgi:hypothetical protein